VAFFAEAGNRIDRFHEALLEPYHAAIARCAPRDMSRPDPRQRGVQSSAPGGKQDGVPDVIADRRARKRYPPV
jgi:hypothetical protein